MSRIQGLNRRYAASASLVRSGVEVTVVGDPAGARLNTATRRLLVAARDDGPGLWDDLVGAAKLLRWRLITQPQPAAFNSGLQDGAEQVTRQAKRLRAAVANTLLLDELVAAAAAVCSAESALCAVLRQSIEEVGSSDCVVVAASPASKTSLSGWLGTLGVGVLAVGELERAQPAVEQVYVVGAPRFFRSSLVTAPVAGAVSFLMPAWFRDRSIPRSAIAPYADGAIRIEARIFTEGDVTETQPDAAQSDEVEDDFLPQPVWGSHESPTREPNSEEVDARKVLLAGNLALWLDDGERIRALDLRQPAGERVIYIEVSAVTPGTHLLLRTGETERPALYEAALALLGSRAQAINAAQRNWKGQLQVRLSQSGYRSVVRELRAAGIKTADRARAWTEPNLVRPHNDHDFDLLLEWLGIPIQPTFGYATTLRRALYQASADVREQLENAVSGADLTALERDGHLTLDVATAGFRGIVATRVLAIAPHSEIVPRHDARVPFQDRSGQWLE
jgi:hypothetical protein